MGYAKDFEIWLPSSDGLREHFFLVTFWYTFVDIGIGPYEYCGCRGWETKWVPDIDLISVKLLSVSTKSRRSIKPHDKLEDRLKEYIESEYDFDEYRH